MDDTTLYRSAFDRFQNGDLGRRQFLRFIGAAGAALGLAGGPFASRALVGRVEQIGDPGQVYNNPASLIVAQCLGAANALPVTVTFCEPGSVAVDARELRTFSVDPAHAAGFAAGESAQLAIRAEKVALEKPAGDPMPGENLIHGTVEAVDYQGQTSRYFVRVADRLLQAINTLDVVPFAQGAAVSIRIQPRHRMLLRDSKGKAA